MFKDLKYIIILSLILPFLGGCADDWLSPEPDGYVNGEKIVEFDLQWPGISSTRAFDDVQVKTKFADGDVIHIVGTFRTTALQPDGTQKEGIESRYGALKYDSKERKWKALEGNELTWPSIATYGDFYAYYISGSNGLFIDYNVPVEETLSSVTPQSDPLMAPSTGYIIYGHAVKLDFHHLCAHLTLVDLEPMVAQNYFFTTDKVQDPETGQTKDFNNAFKLSLVENDGYNPNGTPNDSLAGMPSLKFEFCQSVELNDKGEPNYNGLIYISGNAVESESTDDAGNMKKITKAGFFLEPGLYEQFQLKYPATNTETYDYLSYDYNKIPDNYGEVDYEKTEPNLKAGTTYTLTITKSPGITIEVPPPGDGWDDDGDIYSNIDPKEFLQAVNQGKEYRNSDGVLILEQTAEGTRLLHNVDFKGYTYEDFKNLPFLPDVLEGKVFDGDYHYISNLECPLFRNNYGSIQNIGINGVKFTAESYEKKITEDTDNALDRSRHGALCMWNRSSASISNVRLSDVDITVKVQYDNSDDDSNEVHNVGCLLGSNTGKVEEIYLGGNFNLKVTGANKATGANDVQNAQVLIGGLVGQNAGTGNIYDVSLLDSEFKMNITNECKGKLGLYSVGGIAGQSSGVLSGVILSNVTINGVNSEGVVSYMGGMAGQLTASGTTSASMNSCIVSGSVKAGNTYNAEMGEGNQSYNINGQSYTGGMVGYDDNVAVKGCRASVAVTSAPSASPNVLYGTGGAFGRIASPSTFENLIAYGSMLVAPAGSSDSSYIGNFAGIVPAGQSWEANYANRNIILNSFSNIRNIGVDMSPNN